MPADIQLSDVRRLVIHPGETLVLTVPEGITREDLHTIQDAAQEQLPDGVGLLVISGDVDMDVVTEASSPVIPDGYIPSYKEGSVGD